MRENDSIRGKSYRDYGKQFPDPGVISTPYAVEREERIMRRVERMCMVSFVAGWLCCLVLVLMLEALS